MKQTTTSFSIFLLLIFIFTSCEDIVETDFECSEKGKYFGEKTLSERADSFWSYKANQTRSYINVADNKLEFKEHFEERYQSEIIEYPLNYLCVPPNAEPEYDYADIEIRKVRYQSQNASINLNIQLEVRPILRGDSIYFIDLLTLINRSHKSFVLDYKDTPNDIVFNSQFDFIADTTLLNRTFQNVYYEKEEKFPVFYTKEQGVIAFYDINENFYVLDKIE